MSKMKDFLFMAAADAGVSIQEYELAHAILRDQEMEWAYYEEVGADVLDALDAKDPINELEEE